MKKNLYITWVQYPWDTSPTISINEHDRSAYKETPGSSCPSMLSGGTVEVEVGDQPSEAEFAAGFAINLRAEIGQHQNAITECQRKINELLAIEHKPDAQPDDQRMTEHAEAMRRAAEKFEPQT